MRYYTINHLAERETLLRQYTHLHPSRDGLFSDWSGVLECEYDATLPLLFLNREAEPPAQCTTVSVAHFISSLGRRGNTHQLFSILVGLRYISLG